MTGILVQLAVSFLLIWFLERKDLSVLGFKPTRERMVDLVLFLIVSSILAASSYGLRVIFGNERWVQNPDFSFALLVDGFWWNLKSVLFEELIFRGVLFYILMVRLGICKAILISSVAFGIYHWFSYEVLGNWGQMGYVFIITGLAGVVYAYAYAATGSLYAPIAIHFGWNFTRNFVFSEGQIGDGILKRVTVGPDVTVSYVLYYFMSLSPIIFFLLISFALARYRKRSVPGIKFGR